jgi:hypothetical protein
MYFFFVIKYDPSRSIHLVSNLFDLQSSRMHAQSLSLFNAISIE